MQIYQFLVSFLEAQVSFLSNFASIFSAIKHNSSTLFLAQTLYILCLRIQLKSIFFRVKSFRVKILKWPVNSSLNFASFFIVVTRNFAVNFKLKHSLLWTNGSHESPNFDTFKWSGENLPNSPCHFPNHKPVFLQILHHSSSVSLKITPLYFFSSNNIYFVQKEPIKVKLFATWVLWSEFVKFLMSILKQQVDSPNFVSLFRAMKDNFPVLF